LPSQQEVRITNRRTCGRRHPERHCGECHRHFV